MIYKRFYDAKEFYNETFNILKKHEAQNSLPLGNVVIGNNGGESDGWRNTKNWYMSTVSDISGYVQLVSIMTPPFNITMYETDNLPNDEALNCLCDNIFKDNIEIPGIISEKKLAERFSKTYIKKMNMEYKVLRNMRIYILNKVNNIPLIGSVRKAEKKDLYYLPYWNIGFNNDCNLGSQNFSDAVINIERAINHEMLYVLEDRGMPVSMASALREIINGRCIGMVYTPPYFRKSGYASSCVAQSSQRVLDMGYKYVSLFTDLSNPISNSIYQKIGYKPICDYNEVQFIHS
ncbi:MAG: GNAT family N-acetyltransferase [Eubacteriales bacterium]